MNIKPLRHYFGFSLAWGWQYYYANSFNLIKGAKGSVESSSSDEEGQPNNDEGIVTPEETTEPPENDGLDESSKLDSLRTK